MGEVVKRYGALPLSIRRRARMVRYAVYMNNLRQAVHFPRPVARRKMNRVMIDNWCPYCRSSANGNIEARVDAAADKSKSVDASSLQCLCKCCGFWFKFAKERVVNGQG